MPFCRRLPPPLHPLNLHPYLETNPCPTQILGTFISALVFGLATYFLVLLGIVRRSHLGGSPFIECLAYGGCSWV